MIRARSCFVVFGLGALLASGRAVAQIISIGPFEGQFSETWESFPVSPPDPGTYLPDPTAIMGGFGTISNPRMKVFSAPGLPGLGTSGPAHPSDGLVAMNVESLDTTVTLLFSQPVTQFGAYWGAITSAEDPRIGDPANFHLRFYDSSDALIAAETFTYTRSQFGDGILEWHGWMSNVPIKRVTYEEDGPVIDGLEALVPEPCAAIPIVLGILGSVSKLRFSPIVLHDDMEVGAHETTRAHG
jgi:hypothetical protein